VFAGSQPDPVEFFTAADALALPSLFEPFGNVAMEAMACGLPAMVSIQCGAAEVMPPELSGYVIQDPTDAAEIAHKLDAMLKDAQSLRAVSRAAAAEFTWEKYAQQLNRYIGSLR
jgi:UDP-glucose:(heptosyl)LPS alpha-1,3-glucosyltransferase